MVCDSEQPHKRSFDAGSWEVSGWISNTHRCMCGGDALVSLSIKIGLAGLNSQTELDLCLPCARELAKGVNCQVAAAEAETPVH